MSSCAVKFCNQNPGRAPDKQSNCSGKKSEEKAVLLNKVKFYDDLVKIQTAFQTAKASIQANEAKGIRHNSRH